MLAGTLVRLAPLRRADLGTLFTWINDREAVASNATYRPIHEWDHEAWFDSVTRSRGIAIFAIRTLGDDQLIGTCQLHDIDPIRRSAELQIRIGMAEYRGRGYGREALHLLIKHGFEDLNLQRIQLHVLRSNQHAAHVYERLGFQKEGVLRNAAFIEGEFVDVEIMSLLRTDQYDW